MGLIICPMLAVSTAAVVNCPRDAAQICFEIIHSFGDALRAMGTASSLVFAGVATDVIRFGVGFQHILETLALSCHRP